MTNRIFHTIAVAILVVFLASFGIITCAIYGYFSDTQQEQLKAEVSLAAQGVALQGEAYFDGLNTDGYRITWIGDDGYVICDTESDAEEMGNHIEREEVAQAMEHGSGRSVRYSETMMNKSVYEAQKLDDGSVVRISEEYASIVALAFGMIQPVLLIAVIALALAFFLAFRVSKMVVAPLNNLDLDNPLTNKNVDEVAPLLRRINSQQRLLRIQEIELSKKQEEFDTVIKGMSEGLVLLNKNAKIISINNAAINIFGAGEFSTGKKINEVSESSEIAEITENAFTGERVVRIVEIGGRDYEVDANPILADGVSGLVILIFDVTEKQLAEQMRREFTANVSHELKTPLHLISGCAELLCNDIVKPEDTKQFTMQIYTEAQRMMRLVNDIIYLSRLDEGAADMKRIRIDVLQIAMEVLGSLEHEAAEAEVALEFTYDKGGRNDSLMMDGVPQLISSIIYNLCENAVKYNHAGGRVDINISKVSEKMQEETDRVKAGTQEPSDTKDAACGREYIVLTVADTGIGIPKEHQARVFERFYRVDKSHSKEVGGTGLGLSIVKHAAKVHNASIELSSAAGAGTTVTVKLPISTISNS